MDFNKARQKAKELISQMTVEEKLTQLLYNSPAIERLGINAYNWWNEAAHGVARAGVATVFPQAIAMAASFHPDLMFEVADATSTEARAKYNKTVEYGDYDIYKGLTFWTPNINIFRDPRWGRGQETFGECPYLTSQMGIADIKGLQGEGEFLKSGACSKHFAVHSGPEKLRHSFDAKASLKDMWETYLPAFEQTVKAGVIGVMGAYNRTNGEACCAHSYLLKEVLREKWGFKGYIVSDCGAVLDISEHHKLVDDMKEGSALALKNGCNLNCGEAYTHLVDAYEEDLITEADIDEAVTYLYTVRALLGEFETVRPYSNLPYSLLDCDAHKALNLKAAEETLVLLKNENHFLPIKDGTFKNIAVIGPNATSTMVLEGNYNGYASEYVTVADGMRRIFPGTRITVASGSHLYIEKELGWAGFENLLSEGLSTASEADLTLLCLGLDRSVEGEEIGDLYDDTFDGGDRKGVTLPKTQIKLAEAVLDVCENVVVLVMCGSAVDLGEKINAKAKAIIHGWYPGAQGGLAVARLIKGEYSPSGKLPLTFYRADTILPAFTDYSMKGRTYRFFEGEPRYPFGFGLSYTTFEFNQAEVLSQSDNLVKLSVTLTNNGDMASLEKIQVYAQYTDSRTTTPIYQLCGIKAVETAPGECLTTEVDIDPYWLKAVLENGDRVEPDQSITLFVGDHQPDALSAKLSGTECLKIVLK